MSLQKRIDIQKRIEEIRKRPLIAYVTSARQNAEWQMGIDAIAEFLDQIILLPKGCEAVDLLVVSNGGDPTVAWRMMSLLRERVKRVGVLVPQSAFSAATLLALGADEIVMHSCGNLGPVDPQIRFARQIPGMPAKEILQFGSEDLAGFLGFVRESVGLSSEESKRTAFELFCKEVGAVPIGVAARVSRLAVSMSEKLLGMHMQGEKEAKEAKEIAKALNTKFFHHGYPVGRSEAKEIGLKVVEPIEELEGLMWNLWLDMEAEMESRVPFNAMALVEKSASASIVFGGVPQVNIPSNVPPQLLQSVYQQILQQINVASVPPVDYSLTVALMESPRRASAVTVKGKIFASRGVDLKISVNVVSTSGQWEERKLG